jgi:uncharacterized protein YjbJ (UPF0337 family)
MGERIDEIKGNIKEGVGKVTGNRQMEAEGRTEQTAAKATREAKGAGKQIKGRVEEGLGNVTGNEEVKARGIADRLEGDADRTG